MPQYLTRQERELERKRKSMMVPKTKTKAQFRTLQMKSTLYRRESISDNIPSVSYNVDCTQHNDTLKYTGDKLIGVTILHKSCLQPVFSQEQAIDAAHMRR